MRSFAVLFALALPFFVSAQCPDSSTALCCFDSQDSTIDNLAQLSLMQNTTLPTDIPGSIGLLCAALDGTCDVTLSRQLCCSAADGFDGVLALGCSELQPPIPTDDPDTVDDSDPTDSGSDTGTDGTTDPSDTTDGTTDSTDTTDPTDTTDSLR